mgnify:CR=1 FL=1
MRTIERNIVGTFLISSDAKILLGQSVKGGVYQGVWCVPGGGIEPDETNLEAARRETLEEANVDILDESIELDTFPSYGQSQKTLPESGEQVLVKMNFINYIVRFQRPSKDIPFEDGDDLMNLKWHSLADLPNIKITSAMTDVLKRHGYL